ncbi:hypothetical protein CEXT_666661 [Caerostris extrusa]|uniref:Uncharacterized protein n=1 Tax=Caerostris extrusa TaxID=172846 RepID=A0AAV4YEY2_CAEEX|nr:hypothetical protein CEXT_666661 [Caerostris extrusa]
MSSAGKREDTTSISTSSSEDNVVEKASGNLEQMKLEETAVQEKKENLEQVKSIETPAGTSTALLPAQEPIPGTSRDQHPDDFSHDQAESGSTPRKDLDCHVKESTASDSVEEPKEKQPVPPPEKRTGRRTT